MPSPEAVVYLLGAMLFGFFYEPLKASFSSSWLFVVAAVAYLCLLRGIGWILQRVLKRGEAQ